MSGVPPTLWQLVVIAIMATAGIGCGSRDSCGDTRAEDWLVDVCVRPPLPRVGKVTLSGMVTSVDVPDDYCGYVPGMPPESRKRVQLTDGQGKSWSIDLRLPGLELPVRVGDAVTAIYDNKRQFAYYFLGYSFTLLRQEATVLHVDIAHSPEELRAPGDITFALAPRTCEIDQGCGLLYVHPLKAAAARTAVSLGTGETASIAGYRLLNGGVTSGPAKQIRCADYSPNWARVALVALP